METFTMTYLLACAIGIALIVPMHGMPATPRDDESVQGVEDLEVVPLGFVAQKADAGEDLETANARYYPNYYYFRPVYTYRRTQSQRRRVYSPRRDVDRFPTVA